MDQGKQVFKGIFVGSPVKPISLKIMFLYQDI